MDDSQLTRNCIITRSTRRESGPSFKPNLISLLTGILLVLFGHQTAVAQSSEDVEAAGRSAETIQRQEQDRLDREQQIIRDRSNRIQGLDTDRLRPKPKLKDGDAPCRQIHRINISGATSMSAFDRDQLIDKFRGKCLRAYDIEKLLSGITKNYIDRGLITSRAYLPPQDLGNGRLKILVLEGVVEDLLIQDGGTNSISIANVLPGVKDHVLNLRDLEQGIDQINRLSSNDARLDIKPGAKPGTSRVVIHNAPTRPFHFNFTVDNEGSEATGEVQSGLAAIADNALGFNEMFLLSHRRSTPSHTARKESAATNFSVNIPFGYTTFSAGSNRSDYSSTIYLPSGSTATARGKNAIDHLRLDRVIYRDQSTRASLAATLSSKRSYNYLFDQFLAVSSRKLTVLDIDANIKLNAAGGVVSFSLGYSRGSSALSALKDPGNLTGDASRAQFGKITAAASYRAGFRLFNLDFGVNSQLVGQKADDPLFGSEQISIGSIYSVRGFRNNSLSGDNGYFLRNEVSVRLPFLVGGQKIASRIYLGYDTGEVSNAAPDVPQGHLAGTVIGGSLRWRGATMNLYHTRPVSMPDTMTRESGQTWARLSYSF